MAKRLTKAKRARIESRLHGGDPVGDVARAERISYQTVWRIKNGVSRATGKPRKTYRVLSIAERAEIITRQQAGESMSSLAKEFDVALSAVSRLCNGQSGPHARAR